jgi:ubiquinone/menaquinone biosynthesis C-methylase UbiE
MEMELNESIQRQFTAAASAYVVSPVHKGGPDLDALLEIAGDVREAPVLDVGTGAGATALAFAARGARVVALDLTPAMLDTARAQAEERGLTNLETRLGDAANLPFPDASFEVVTCRVCAHHFGRARQAVAEMARVLRPGGQLLLIDSISPEDPAQDTFLNAVELLRDRSHVRNHRVSEWLAWFREVELAPEHVRTFPTFLDFENWTARMNTPEHEKTQLRRLMDGAPAEVREAFSVADNHDWQIPLALFRAVKP